jgi:hypothetical protein
VDFKYNFYEASTPYPEFILALKTPPPVQENAKY